MDIQHYKKALFGIFEDQDGKEQEAWFAWLAVRVTQLLRPNNEIHIWEYDNIAEAMQEAASGFVSKSPVPEIEII